MQKIDHSQFTSFVLGEFEQISNTRKTQNKIYFFWVGCLMFSILGLVLGVFGGGEVDRRITLSLFNLFSSNSFFLSLGNLFQYSYFVFLGGALVCLVIIILSMNPKTKSKVESASKYASLYLLVMVLSFFVHLLVQIIVNRPSFDPGILSPHPFYQANPSFSGVWYSSFPNNNLILSGVVILFPVLFGNRSPIFKWIMGVLSGILVLGMGFTAIGISHAWFSDVFGSISISLFFSWLLYWHILFIKDRECTDFYHELTGLYYQAYGKLIESKTALEAGDVEECKKLLKKARELYNQSISSIQNHSGDTSQYQLRNEFWKFNVSLLSKEVESSNTPSRKWLYIF